MRKVLVNIFLAYLRFFARLRLRRVSPQVIGVGGSSGKSSTSLLIAQILKDKHVVLESKGKNSQTGIPLSILGLSPRKYRMIDWLRIALLSPFKAVSGKHFDYFVIEMGIDSPFPPNNMAYLLRVVKPDIGVLTNISLEHSVYFDPLSKGDNDKKRRDEILKATAQEELQLIKSLGSKATSVVNMDNEFIKSSLNTVSSNLVTISASDKNATFYIREQEISLKGYSLIFKYKNNYHKIVLSHALPIHYGYTILLALGACVSSGIEFSEALSAIKKNFKLPAGRLSLFKGIRESYIIDSSYNSSLDPAIEVLEMVNKIGEGKRKLGILGDMREMGSLTKLTHEELAKSIAQNLDFAILIGPSMAKYVAPILREKNFKFVSFDTYEKARYRIHTYIERRDVVVVKGSQNTLFLERAVERLLKDKRDAIYLCRRGEYWEEIRSDKKV